MRTPERPDDMRELIDQIARALVDIPEAVRVEEEGSAEATRLLLRVAPLDVGKVIGKQGRTARSMRTILSAVSMKHRHRYSLDIVEDGDPGPDAGLAGTPASTS